MIELLVTSLSDRQRVVEELWRDDIQLAEVSEVDGVLRIEVYARPGTNRVAMPLADLGAAIERAKSNLE